MNPKKPKLVSGRVKKSPSFELIRQLPSKVLTNGGVLLDFSTNTENIREVSRKLGYNILQDATFFYSAANYAESKNFSQNRGVINLLQRTEEFDNAYWTKVNAILSTNSIIAPNGTLTADKLIADTVNFDHIFRVVVGSQPAGQYTNSVYIKQGDYNYSYVVMSDNSHPQSFCTYDFSAGTISVSAPSFSFTSITGNVQSVGDGWFRLSISVASNATFNLRFDMGVSNNPSIVFSGDNTKGNYFWGAQTERSISATTYQKQVSVGDGIVDFNFTRATISRVLNKENVVEDSCYNLALRSEEYDNAAWNKNVCTVSPNIIIAPNGTLTADKVVETTGNGIHAVTQTYTFPRVEIYNFSTYAKAGERTFIRIANANITFGTVFDLTNGIVLSSTTFGTINTAIENVGNGWYRCSMSFYNHVNLTDTYFLETMQNSTNFNYVGDGVSGMYVWGTQLTFGPILRPYLRTTTRLNVPKLDYSRSNLESTQLIEPSRTNIILQSQTFDIAPWSYGSTTIAPNIITAPDGTLTGDKLIETAVSSQHYTLQGFSVATTIGVNYTISIYARAGERDLINIQYKDGGVFTNTIFDVLQGKIVFNEFSIPPIIIPMPDGWYRCIVTRTATTTSGTVGLLLGISNSIGGLSYTGILNYGLYIWGIQIEVGLNATTYIPTTTVAVTRNADNSYVDLFNNSMLNSNSFTLYWEGFLYDGLTNNFSLCLSDTNTAASNTNQIGWYNQLRPFYSISNTLTTGIDLATNNSFNKFLVQYSAGTANFYINGINAFPNRSVPAFNYRYLVLNSGNSTFGTDKVVLWNRGLSSGECATLTSNIPFANIVAYYKFDNNSNDLISSTHNGVDTNINYLSTGKTVNSASFSGSSYITVPQSTDFDFSTSTSDLPFSISFWINLNAGSGYRLIVNKDNGSTPQWSIRMGSGQNQLELVLVTNPGNYKWWQYPSSLLSINTWYHVVFTYDGLSQDSSTKMYLNNVLITPFMQNLGTYVKMPISNTPLVIGQSGYGGNFFNGKLDELAIWKNYILSPSEINTIYNKGLSGLPLI